MNCVFCKLISGEFPSHRVFEDDLCIAFLDIHPINPGHILVTPRRHVERYFDLQKEEAARMASTACVLYQALRKTDLRCEGANIFISDGEVAGQEVKHCHLHIAPRFLGDRQRLGFTHAESADQAELTRVAELIRLNT